jgi:microcystin-dependent protein
MPVDFPTSPAVGQQYTYAGVIYTYTTQGIWSAAGSSGLTLNNVTLAGSCTAPTPSPGDADTSIATTAFVAAAITAAGASGAAFHATAPGGQTIATETWTKITLSSEVFDVGNYYDAANSRWTPPAGRCLIAADVYFDAGLLLGTPVYIAIAKNGSIWRYAPTGVVAYTVAAASLAIVDSCNGTDYYEIFAHIFSSTTGRIFNNSFFTATMLGGAGPPGPTGPQGAPGSVWFEGTGTPAAGTGINGDFYLDDFTGNVYQKTAGAWAIVANIANPGGSQAAGFRAHKNGVTQTGIASATYTKVTFGTEDYDRGGYYDAANSRWTPPAGLVHLDARAWINAGMTATTSFALHVYKNGALFRTQWLTSSANGVDAAIVNFDDVASGTDFYELFVYLSSTTTGQIYGAADYTFFSGHVVSQQGPKGDTGATGPPAPVGAMQPSGFRAHKNGVDQTGVGPAYTKITFGTEDYDQGGYYDVANSRWTPPAGLVHIDGAFYVPSGLSSGANLHAVIYKNGAQLRSTFINLSTTVNQIQISLDDLANGTDYYELWSYTPTGSTVSINGGALYTFFGGHVTGGPVGPTGPQGVQGPPTVDISSTTVSPPLTFTTGTPNVLGIDSKIVLPVGMVSPFAGPTAPAGWILCDGRNVNRTTYSALFAVISTTYGAGDGSTTFGIPDCRARAVFGRDPSEATARITAAISGLNSGTLGGIGGSQYLHSHGHTLTDPSHNHTHNDPAHNHTLNDPTHNHTLNDPTHVHGIPQDVAHSGGYYIRGADAAFGETNATAGAYTGCYNSANYTGCYNSAAYTGVTNNAAYTGITISASGSGASQNIPPGIVLNYIIFAGV